MKKNITITALLNLIFISPTWGQYDAEKEAIANDPYSAAAAHNAARQSLWSMSNADITTIERPVFSTGQGWGTERAWHSTRPNITVTRRPAHATSNQSGNTYSSNATVYQSGGIQFSYDSPVSTSRRQPSTHAQQEADRKRKRDIERHEFYERKREAAARAAEAERIRQEAKKREQERIRAQVTAATYVALGPSTQAKQDAAYYRAHERVYEGAEQHTSSHLMNVTEGNNFGQGDYTTPNRNFRHSLKKKTNSENSDDAYEAWEKWRLEEYANSHNNSDKSAYDEEWSKMKNIFSSIQTGFKRIDSYLDANNDDFWNEQDWDNNADEGFFKGTVKYIYTNTKEKITGTVEKVVNIWNYCRNFPNSVSVEDIMKVSIKPIGGMVGGLEASAADMEDAKKFNLSIIRATLSPDAAKRMVAAMDARTASDAWGRYTAPVLNTSKVGGVRLAESVSQNHGGINTHIPSQLVEYSTMSEREAKKKLSKQNAEYIQDTATSYFKKRL